MKDDVVAGSSRPSAEEMRDATAAPIVSVGAEVDVEQLIADIRAEVDRKAREHVYPPELILELESHSDPLAAGIIAMRDAAGFSMVAPINTPTRASLRYVAPGVVLTKKVIRKGLGWHTKWLVEQMHHFSATVVEAMSAMAARLRDHQESIRSLQESIGSLQGQSDESLKKLRSVEARLPSAAGSPADQSAEVDRVIDYRAFENMFRGESEKIKLGQRAYLECFTEAAGPIVDIGCGRGEFLQLLRAAGREAYGVDSSPGMVEHCRQLGLDTRLGNGLEHLADLPNGCLAGIFCAQVIEHFDPRQLVLFIEQAARVLGPGGVLVAETLNPQSLAIFTNALYVDLGHLRPLHPVTVRFLAEVAGFSQIDIRYSSQPAEEGRLRELPAASEPALSPLVDTLNQNLRRLNEVLFGPQDFALVARR